MIKSSIILYDGINCPVIKSWIDPEYGDHHHEILYKHEKKILYESSIGLGEVLRDGSILDYIVYSPTDQFKSYYYHRDVGPSEIYHDMKVWCYENECHRFCGPAVITVNREYSWYWQGKKVCQEEYEFLNRNYLSPSGWVILDEKNKKVIIDSKRVKGYCTWCRKYINNPKKSSWCSNECSKKYKNKKNYILRKLNVSNNKNDR